MVWYEEEVKGLERARLGYTYAAETVFYGSSSIRLWSTLKTDFKEYKPVNLGFGGSTLAACVWFFDRIVVPLQPKRIVFYAGDNDLGDGRNPEEVYIFFKQLIVMVKESLGDIPFAYISIKPSITRWGINDSIKYANKLISNDIKKHPNGQFIDVYKQMIDVSGYPKRDLFVPDGLHLSVKGYEVWKGEVLKYLNNL